MVVEEEVDDWVVFWMTEVDGVVAPITAFEERSLTGCKVETMLAVEVVLELVLEVEEVVVGAGDSVSTSTDEVTVASVAISSVVEVTWLFSRVIALTRVVVYEDVLTTTVAGLIVLVITA